MSISSGSLSSNSDMGDFANLANNDAMEDDNRSVQSFHNENNFQQSNQHQSSSRERESSPQELNVKRDYLVKLHDLKAKGYKLTGSYSMDTDVNDLILEYERHTKTMKKNNSLAFSKKALMLSVQGMEMLSSTDPFGLKIDLEGWSDNVNPDEFTDILEELIEKYSGDSNTPPEMRLVFGLATSAIAVHVGNTMFGKKKQKRNKMSRRLSSHSSIGSINESVREPDFSNVMNMLNAKKPNVNVPNVKLNVNVPKSDSDSDSEIILPQEIESERIIYSDSSSDESSSGPSSDENNEEITIKEVEKIAVGAKKRGRPAGRGSIKTRPTGRGRGRGRPTNKNVITI
jgi:hypothetical protein